jgi:SpoVK/Ycf46/Vps4 family AAA+-type ATPase
VSSGLIEHMVFTGPPGTGKTTIARVLARLYRALGLLPADTVVEVDRGGLVAGYVGQTAIRTAAKIDEAMGGVLFIDEAYALASPSGGTGHDFGKEAIDTLLKRMEDDRGTFMVIAAGYPDDMEHFLESNPGLRSRFTKKIAFSSYLPEELVRIAVSMAAHAGQTLTEEARAIMRARLDAAESAGALERRDWGNARTVRNVVDEAIRLRDLRLFDTPDPAAEVTVHDLETLTAADVEAACDAMGI